MSTLKATMLPRELYLNETRLPDPSPELPIEQVRDILSTTYPELATARLEGPEDTGTALRFNFRSAIGSKG